MVFVRKICFAFKGKKQILTDSLKKNLFVNFPELAKIYVSQVMKNSHITFEVNM